MISAPEQILTARLTLRKPRPEDAALIYERYAQDAEVRRFLLFPPPKEVADTESFLVRCLKVWEAGSAFPYVIERKEDGRLMGMVEIRMDGFQADIGYVLERAEWGRGYTSEAAKAIVDWALGLEEIVRVWAICDTENLASARVMEKAGMHHESLLRRYLIHPNLSPEPRDVFMYSKVK